MKNGCIILLFILTACGPAPVITDAPAVHHWTAKEWGEILQAEKTPPPDSILIPVLEDYVSIHNALAGAHTTERYSPTGLH
jgi:hypothetical protein